MSYKTLPCDFPVPYFTQMLSPTKYPLILLLFTLILATITHAAPVAASLQVERRGDPKPYEKELRLNVDEITEMENLLRDL